MSTLAYSPIVDSEVFARATQSDHNLASWARKGWHEEGAYFHDAWLAELETGRLLNTAREQRLYRHPLGLEGATAERLAAGRES